MGVFVGCSQKDSNQSSKQAPSFRSKVFSPENQPDFHLSEINRSQPVLLIFWTTWCPSCQKELPKLNGLASFYGEKIKIAAVNVQEDPDEVSKYLDGHPMKFSVLLDPEGEISNLFEVTAIPSVLLLAKGGEILYYGFRLPDKEKLDAALTV